MEMAESGKNWSAQNASRAGPGLEKKSISQIFGSFSSHHQIKDLNLMTEAINQSPYCAFQMMDTTKDEEFEDGELPSDEDDEDQKELVVDEDVKMEDSSEADKVEDQEDAKKEVIPKKVALDTVNLKYWGPTPISSSHQNDCAPDSTTSTTDLMVSQFLPRDELSLDQLKSFKNWKLVEDPELTGELDAPGIYRFEGIIFECDPKSSPRIVPTDARLAGKRKFSRSSFKPGADLPVPKMKVDANFVGTPPAVEVTVKNFNESVNEPMLALIVGKCGQPESMEIFKHPTTQGHLGLAHVVFKNPAEAAKFIRAHNGKSFMGSKLSVFLDARRQRLARAMKRAEDPDAYPPSPEPEPEPVPVMIQRPHPLSITPRKQVPLQYVPKLAQSDPMKPMYQPCDRNSAVSPLPRLSSSITPPLRPHSAESGTLSSSDHSSTAKSSGLDDDLQPTMMTTQEDESTRWSVSESVRSTSPTALVINLNDQADHADDAVSVSAMSAADSTGTDVWDESATCSTLTQQNPVYQANEKFVSLITAVTPCGPSKAKSLPMSSGIRSAAPSRPATSGIKSSHAKQLKATPVNLAAKAAAQGRFRYPSGHASTSSIVMPSGPSPQNKPRRKKDFIMRHYLLTPDQWKATFNPANRPTIKVPPMYRNALQAADLSSADKPDQKPLFEVKLSTTVERCGPLPVKANPEEPKTPTVQAPAARPSTSTSSIQRLKERSFTLTHYKLTPSQWSVAFSPDIYACVKVSPIDFNVFPLPSPEPDDDATDIEEEYEEVEPSRHQASTSSAASVKTRR